MFTLYRAPEKEGRIFVIVTKKQYDKKQGLISRPFEVYGFLKVVGNSYNNSHVSYMNIADEILLNKEMPKLEKEARKEVFGVN